MRHRIDPECHRHWNKVILGIMLQTILNAWPVGSQKDAVANFETLNPIKQRRLLLAINNVHSTELTEEQLIEAMPAIPSSASNQVQQFLAYGRS